VQGQTGGDMGIYLRLLFFPLLFVIILSVFLYSRNEVFCYFDGGDDGLKIQTERYINMERKSLGDKATLGNVKCNYTDYKIIENMTPSNGYYYVACNRSVDGRFFDNVVFVLSRCFYIKDEVYLDSGI
jgi:hypothetical protein